MQKDDATGVKPMYTTSLSQVFPCVLVQYQRQIKSIFLVPKLWWKLEGYG